MSNEVQYRVKVQGCDDETVVGFTYLNRYQLAGMTKLAEAVNKASLFNCMPQIEISRIDGESPEIIVGFDHDYSSK